MQNEQLGGEYVESPASFGRIIAIAVGLMILVFFISTLIDNRASQNDYDRMIQGIRRGTKMYSQTYSKSTVSMSQLGEGYIIAEDSELSIDSNPIVIDTSVACRNFKELLGANMVLSNADVSALDIYLVQVYSTFSFIGTNVKTTYSFKINDQNGVVVSYYTGGISSTTILAQKIKSAIGGIDIDIDGSFNASIRKAQEYDRKGQTGSFENTASTYNTFICIGKGIPLKARYGLNGVKTVDVLELQTYSTKR